jgi:cytochrome c peroxidase
MRGIIIFVIMLFVIPADKPARITDYIKKTQITFAAKAVAMQQSFALIDSAHPATLEDAKIALKQCRISYKQLAFFLEYFFSSEAYVFNSPPKYEIDEPFIEYEAPVGLQQMESILYDSAVYTRKADLIKEAEVVVTTANDIPSLLYKFSATDTQIMESVKLELIRIMTLYITGYDAPSLKSGVEEAAAAMNAIDNVVSDDSLHYYLQKATVYLNQNKDFDSFNRLEFLTDYALPLQKQLHTTNLFSKLDITAFPGGANKGDAGLGRRLFFEKALSGTNTRSCATCHQPDKYFTDGLVKNVSLEGGLLSRNTLGLLYSCYQYSQFWDGRVKSLEEQIVTVMHSKQEMDVTDDTILHRLPGLKMDQIVNALAAYLRTLAPFSSPFDQYMNGDHTALTPQQQKGFNLFMGKGQCGSCHFAPVFNGLTPPLYNRTEFEVLGTPDIDEGRYSFFKIDFYKGAFKTPTVRNAAATAPYMHHGAYSNMEEVLDFYDKGGLRQSNQTLSATPLHLDDAEKKAIIAFMEGLKDVRF